ncbi:TrkA family potassium uptake protein [Treponema phagedenis]|uniref:TrkA N-terminal domain protein n=1 Tax=Treponema phagedenis TaxID=162 RepID=A0A0B7GRL1_TREPH|nr:TrkA family potassium uptake protein [Treponema phagedenis]NVP25605.1 TrkA family potassium uptake protein [Treponema phagedenis]QEJ94316.1 TrkA family potassium uptake protein [Treponema phagedenis]QEK00275.1 TrkA family potassium uptake protein [Treponema phagedenis]QEK04520.1 TrkA family potassium uptake protein [Treponema phagedenis]QEK07767.1 TrkA family potassium uptake protein [Treponema phagedenis]
MKKFAIIGLGPFGLRMLEELLKLTNEIIIVDKDPQLIAKYDGKAKISYAFDVIDETSLKKAIPPDVNAAIVDLGGKIEFSIMVTTYLKKMNVKEILVKAQNDEHGKILSMVGATNVIFPDREAAKRVMPMLASELLFNFMPISETLALAEVGINKEYAGKTLLETNLRKTHGINVVAIRKQDTENFYFINDPNYPFEANDILLVAGSEEDIFTFSQDKPDRGKKLAEVFRNLFPKH